MKQPHLRLNSAAVILVGIQTGLGRVVNGGKSGAALAGFADDRGLAPAALTKAHPMNAHPGPPIRREKSDRFLEAGGGGGKVAFDLVRLAVTGLDRGVLAMREIDIGGTNWVLQLVRFDEQVAQGGRVWGFMPAARSAWP